MRLYNIVASGIFLIISIIDFGILAAPVLVQEKHQECANVVHIVAKDVITVLGKRWEEDLEKLSEKYFRMLENPEESSATHTSESSSSAPSESDHGPTNVLQAPAPPNPASSTAYPHPFTEPSSPSSSIASTQSSWGDQFNGIWDDVWLYKANYELHGPLYTPTSSTHGSSGYGSDHEFFTKAHAHAPQTNPNPNLRPSTYTADSSTDSGQEFDWYYSEDPPPPRPASPAKEFGQAYKYQYQVDPLPVNPPASTSGYAPSPPEPEHEVTVVTPSPPSSNLRLGSPKEPEDELVPGGLPSSPDHDSELHLDHQSLSADSQPVVDLQASIYAAKGKAKESRRISDDR